LAHVIPEITPRTAVRPAIFGVGAATPEMGRPAGGLPQILRKKFDWLREVLAFDFEASLMTGQAQQTAIILLGSWRHGPPLLRYRQR
jgi:hypothetical protein